MKHERTKQEELMCALIAQVSNAAGNDAEVTVRTVISRPMWDRWCEAIGEPIGAMPTAWLGKKTVRVYGSETVVVESDELFAVSYKPQT